MQIKQQTEFIAEWQRVYPNEWKEVYPRRIACPPGYVDPKYLSCHYLFKLMRRLSMKDMPDDKREGAMLDLRCHVIAMCINQKMPFYFVKPELVDAVKNTNPPDFVLDELHMPRNPIIFVWPFNALTLNGHHCAFTTCAKLPPTGEIKSTSYLFGHIICDADNFHGEEIQLSHGLSTFNEILQTKMDRVVVNKDLFGLEQEATLARDLTCFTLKMLLVINTAPKLVEEPTHWGKQTPHIRNHPDTIWNPTWIGASYKIHREQSTTPGHHASPVMHFRRGHLRKQVCGKGRTEHKIIWIEPVLVNGKV